MKPINLDNVVIGSGLSALSFANEFLKKIKDKYHFSNKKFNKF